MKNFQKILALGLLLTGCDKISHSVAEGLEKTSDGFEYIAGKRPNKNAIKEPVYCYKTWAEVTCFTEPQRGQDARLVGHFEPPPPPPPAPVKVSKNTVSDSNTVPVYDIQVNDLSKESASGSESSVPAIKPLIKR